MSHILRATRTAISLVTKTTPSCPKLKALLYCLSENFQQTTADKTVEAEAHHEYQQMIRKRKGVKTTNCQKLIQATVVMWETIVELCDSSSHSAILQKHTMTLALPTTDSFTTTPISPLSPLFDETDGLWEKTEAVEVAKDSIGESSEGRVQEAVWLRGQH
ncbi:hypothetical protein HOY80DRAFT_1039521 [Tuber brumale]|nr:hypothetical protein HOY80DRAFT_1039521 [Tuber brumale]